VKVANMTVRLDMREFKRGMNDAKKTLLAIERIADRVKRKMARLNISTHEHVFDEAGDIVATIEFERPTESSRKDDWI